MNTVFLPTTFPIAAESRSISKHPVFVLVKATFESRFEEKEGLDSMAQPVPFARREDEPLGLMVRSFRPYSDSDGAGTDGAQ